MLLINSKPYTSTSITNVIFDTVSSSLEFGLSMVQEILPPSTEDARIDQGLERFTHHRRVVFQVLKTLLDQWGVVIWKDNIALNKVPLSVQPVRAEVPQLVPEVRVHPSWPGHLLMLAICYLAVLRRNFLTVALDSVQENSYNSRNSKTAS